jgi:aryl-alcohol dehydrogenase-like predicted oxidoreductase
MANERALVRLRQVSVVRAASPEVFAKIDTLAKVASDLGATLSQLAIAWTLNNPHVSTTILGASKPEQLSENLKAAEFVDKLDDGVIKAIEGILNNKP